jgi:hypothetical protein
MSSFLKVALVFPLLLAACGVDQFAPVAGRNESQCAWGSQRQY